jgi:hypothetical protein
MWELSFCAMRRDTVRSCLNAAKHCTLMDSGYAVLLAGLDRLGSFFGNQYPEGIRVDFSSKFGGAGTESPGVYAHARVAVAAPTS